MDSDELEFEDDLILDETMVAALDSAEKSYFNTTTPSEPPTKKRKLDVPSFDPNLPDISVNADGTYAIQSRRPTRQTTSRANPTVPNQSMLRSRPRKLDSNSSEVTQAHKLSHKPSHPISHAHNFASGSASSSPISSTPLPIQDIVSPPSHLPMHTPNQDMVRQLEEFQAKLAELRAQNIELSAKVAEATKIRYTRDGEIAILRKGIEKTSKDHETELQVLRQAKVDTETRLSRIQREMKDEVERMKTQFIFKQHEIEASRTGKAPGTARQRRTIPPTTPLPLSQHMPRFPPSAGAPLRHLLQDTPMRPPPPKFRPSPKKTQTVLQSPDKKKKQTLPGFQNAFTTSTPVKPISGSKGKVKQKEVDDADFWTSGSPLPRNQSQLKRKSDLITPIFASGPNHIDVEMIHEPIPFSPTQQESNIVPPPSPTKPSRQPVVPVPESSKLMDGMEVDPIENIFDDPLHFSWKDTMSRIIVFHTHHPAASPTLQLLIKIDVSILTLESQEAYIASCSHLLATISSAHVEGNYAVVVSSVCTDLMVLFTAFHDSDHPDFYDPLIALIDLFGVLCFSLPKFSETLLSLGAPNSEESSILRLSSILLVRWLGVQQKMESGVNEGGLGRRVLTLLEALSFRAKDDGIDRLAIFAAQRDVVLILLSNSFPSSFLSCVITCYMTLLLHPPVCKSFLTPAPDEEERPAHQGQGLTVLQLSHVERICTIFVDICRNAKPKLELQNNILSFFGLLALRGGEEGVRALNISPMFIPCLVLLIFQLTNTLWEIDSGGMDLDLPVPIKPTMETLSHAVFILHHLVTSTKSAANLRARLQEAPFRTFNGITHMFIVAFGRLSHSEAPEWLDEEARNDLEVVHDMAETLLDLVVVGPEVNGIYDSFHFDETRDETEIAEDAMEEELLG